MDAREGAAIAKDDITPRDDRLIIPPTSYAIVGPQATDPGAQAVIDDNSNTINSFVYAQRQQVALSAGAYHRAATQTPNLDIEYRNNMGEERIYFTPYVAPSPPDVPPEPPTYAQPTIPPFTPPTPPDPVDLYLLVLFKGSRIAAFDMSTIAAPRLAPYYEADTQSSSFRQPVLTGQYLFGKVGFIQTDVDLSGRRLAKSVLSTTAIRDAVSLGRQVLPLFNSDTPMTTATPFGITLYTATGSYLYVPTYGFTLTRASLFDDQPVAIDAAGTAYFMPTFGGSGYVSLTVDEATLDFSIVQPAIDAAEEPLVTWLSFHSFNSLRAVLLENKNTYTINCTPVNEPINGQYITGGNYLYPGQYKDSYGSTSTETVTIAATVVGNSGPDVPPAHVNQNDITEFLGVSYYGVARLNTTPIVAGLALAYDTVPYYEYSIETNFYENFTFAGGKNADYSGHFIRMNFDQRNGLQVVTDGVTATAGSTVTITTQSQTIFPEFGGDLYNGFTNEPPNVNYGDPGIAGNFLRIPTPDGYSESDANGDAILDLSTDSKQLDLHSTVGPPAGYTGASSYEQVEQVRADLLAILTQPIPGPNGAPIVETFTGMSSSYTTNTQTTVLYPPTAESDYRYYTVQTYEAGTPVTSSTPLGKSPPGYKAQTVTQFYDCSISWLGVTITGHTDAMTTTTGAIVAQAFPPSYQSRPYYSVSTDVTTVDGETSTFQLVTPYGSYSAGTFAPWLHVSNAKHCIQGYLIDGRPQLFLDGRDFMSVLTKALDCLSSDIAAMYMDISLETIQSLARIN